MRRRPPRSTRTATLFPYTTLFRSSTGPRAALDSLISTIAKAWPPQIHGLALSCIVRPDRRGAGVGFLSGRTVHHLGNESMLVPMTVKTPPQTGRASCRERVCQYV